MQEVDLVRVYDLIPWYEGVDTRKVMNNVHEDKAEYTSLLEVIYEDNHKFLILTGGDEETMCLSDDVQPTGEAEE